MTLSVSDLQSDSDLDHSILAKKHFVFSGQKNQVLCEMIKKGPNCPNMAPNDQKPVILIIWDHFGPSETTLGHRQACHVWPHKGHFGPACAHD